MTQKRWMIVGILVGLCLCAIFGDQNRVHYLCDRYIAAPMISIQKNLESICGDQTEQSHHPGKASDNH